MFHQISLMSEISCSEFVGKQLHDLISSHFISLCPWKSMASGKRKLILSPFEKVSYTDINTKLTLRLARWRHLLPHKRNVESTLHAYHLPSMKTSEQGHTANNERRAVVYYSSISRASLPLTVNVLATEIIYHLTVQFRYI